MTIAPSLHRAAAAATALSLLTGAAAAQTFSLERTFDDPTVTASDRFGISVALDGDNVLVGADLDDTAGSDVGQAHLFSASTGVLLRTFDDPTVTDLDGFGASVAVDGDNVLIGANGDDTNGANVGQAHLFSASTGALLQTFDDPTVTTGDRFGFSVALDGDNVLIAANGDNTNGRVVGQAHLFSASTGALLRTFDDPTVTSVDVFGFSVALDGDNVLIGAPGDDTNGRDVGQAHLFSASTGALLRTFDNPAAAGGDRFGGSVALDGDNVLIGAGSGGRIVAGVGQAHLFSASTGALLRTFDNPTAAGGDEFGRSVALDGDNVLIAAIGDDTNGTNVGRAHLFSASTGAPVATFDDPTPTSSDLFGTSVALAGDNVLIGASGDFSNGGRVGQAHLFTAEVDAEVPLPAGLPLYLTGLGLFGLWRWRRGRA